MTKVITINSCRECPCSEIYHHHKSICHRYKLMIENINTIHPDCKLNDLPTELDIEYFSRSVSPTVQMSRSEGANFVINKINEQH